MVFFVSVVGDCLGIVSSQMQTVNLKYFYTSYHDNLMQILEHHLQVNQINNLLLNEVRMKKSV